MFRSLLAAIAVAALASACGGSSGPSATFSGTIRGQSFAPKDAQSTTGTVTLSTTTPNIQAASIVITDQAGICANITAGKEKASSHYLVILLSTLTPQLTTSVGTATGDYVVFNPTDSTHPAPAAANFSVVFGQTTDATCKDVVANDALGVSGTVHVTTAVSGAYSGSYDVQVAAIDATGKAVAGATEHLTGTFSTAACAGLAPAIAVQRSLTCI